MLSALNAGGCEAWLDASVLNARAMPQSDRPPYAIGRSIRGLSAVKIRAGVRRVCAEKFEAILHGVLRADPRPGAELR